MMGKKRLILVGKGGSGKDHARKISENIIGAKYAVSYTSRPPRDGEVEGVDYFFVDESFFTNGIENNFWYEYVIFNGWYYGTSNEQFQNDKLFIMTPKGLSHLSEEDRNESGVLYLNIPSEIRRERMLARNGNADSVDRRMEADELDLGAVWLGVAPQEDRMSEVRAILNIPEHLEVFAIVPCGYPLSQTKQQDRFEEERVHYIQ